MTGYLNDLWMYSNNQWTWVNGNSTVNSAGNYGILKTANPANSPRSRRNAISWIDNFGSFWIFGGQTYQTPSSEGVHNIDKLMNFN